MVRWARLRMATALMAIFAVCGADWALAQGMPSPFVQEVLVKSILVTLSDAVAADNFTVLNAKISKPFRDQFPPEKLRAIFKELIDKHAVFDAVVASPVVSDEDAKKVCEQRRDKLGTPERREVSQMVFPNAEEALTARGQRVGPG